MTTKIGGNTTVRYCDCGTGFQPVKWNICETRNGSNKTTYQYVWGTKYTDELILIDKNLDPTVDNDADADTDTAAEAAAGAEDARYLVHQDRNWNVIALSDYDPDSTANDAVIVERYSYTPYGRFVVLKGDSGGDQLGNVLMTSAVGNVFAHQGLPMDWEKGSYQNRWREYVALVHPFRQPDPLAYLEGLNLYAYARQNPIETVDPLGLQKLVRRRSARIYVDDGLSWGHYCGADRNGNDFEDPPIDETDEACAAHDACYEENKVDWREGTCTDARVQCDCDLIVNLTEATPGSPEEEAYNDAAKAFFCAFLAECPNAGDCFGTIYCLN